MEEWIKAKGCKIDMDEGQMCTRVGVYSFVQFLCEYIEFNSIPLCTPDVCITLTLVYAFPCVFSVLACPHVHMFAPACNTGLLACVSCASVCMSVVVCVCVCVVVRACVCERVPGEPMAGQRLPSNQGYTGGGDADDRQPLRFCFPPLCFSSTPLQKLQGSSARGTTMNTHTFIYMSIRK